MATDADYQEVYDFETIISQAVASVFTDNGFTAANALTAQSDPEFQNVRPRLEIWFKLTSGYLPIQMAVMPDDTLRQQAFKGLLSVYIFSDADAPSRLVHSTFRAKVRAFCANLANQVNATKLTRHKIHALVDADTGVGIRTKKGHQSSLLNFSIDFSIQADALAALV